MKAQRESSGSALLILNISPKREWVGGQRHAPTALPQINSPGNAAKKDGWAPGTVCKGVEKIKSLAPTRIRTPHHPDRNESLHRLRYPGPLWMSISSKHFLELDHWRKFIFLWFRPRRKEVTVPLPWRTPEVADTVFSTPNDGWMTPETCRVTWRRINVYILLHRVGPLLTYPANLSVTVVIG